MVTITHAKHTGAPADSTALVDGPAWDAAHVVTGLQASDVAGLAPSATTDTTNAGNISNGTLSAARLPALASSTLPLMNGTASAGASTLFSRQDHVHPTDTSRAPLISPAFTGTPTSTTPSPGDSSANIATTSFVANALSSYETTSALTTTLSSYALLASPAFTGTPTAPTAANGTNNTQLATTACVLANGGFSVMRSYLAGLTLSTAGGSATFTAAAGQAADSTNTYMVTLASAMSKNTSTWVAGSGNGGLDTGTISSGTWYHAYLIYKPSTATVDVLVSLSATSPTLPSGYTAFRRIGSMKTDGSSHWVAFTQYGDDFVWSTTVQDINNATQSTSLVTYTMASVPTGVVVLWKGIVGGATTINEVEVRVVDLNRVSGATGWSQPSSELGTVETTSGFSRISGPSSAYTNTSAQIAAQAGQALAGFFLNTTGWTDRRGRDA